MMTPLTEDTKATLLLCGIFDPKRMKSSERSETLRPLALGEYNALAQWLQSYSLRPQAILQKEVQEAAAEETFLDVTRLKTLMARGAQLAFAVEEWHKDGIWVISRSDADYPRRYKEHLEKKCPPLLFGVGNRSLLCGGGLAVVGSRNVDAASAEFTRSLATMCARHTMPVVSGGADGVDSIAMQTCIEAGGVSIGILADSLLKKSVERSARHAISEGNLLLISPYHPRSPFHSGSAMGRNKLIYALAGCALVVCAQAPKSGTLSGATEEIQRANAIPIFVRLTPHVPQGNWELLALGAVPWLDVLTSDVSIENRTMEKFLLLFSTTTQKEVLESTDAKSSVHEKHALANRLYEAVLPILMEFLKSARTVDEIVLVFDVTKKQANAWLNRAVAEKKMIRLSKPVRYQKASTRTFVQGTLL